MTETPAHLVETVTERGFTRLPAIPSEYGGDIRAYESSAASGPHVWVAIKCPVDLNNPLGETMEAHVHLTAEHAWYLADQLRWLVENHYLFESEAWLI